MQEQLLHLLLWHPKGRAGIQATGHDNEIKHPSKEHNRQAPQTRGTSHQGKAGWVENNGMQF
jgi:hypothetical protein